jgi:hypothetical protein
MRITSRRGTIVFFVCLGAALVALAVALNVGWIILNWRQGLLLVFGIIFFALIIAGMIVNTSFLVREIRRSEQHDSFINAVTHELKPPSPPSACIWKPCSAATCRKCRSRIFTV